MGNFCSMLTKKFFLTIFSNTELSTFFANKSVSRRLHTHWRSAIVIFTIGVSRNLTNSFMNCNRTTNCTWFIRFRIIYNNVYFLILKATYIRRDRTQRRIKIINRTFGAIYRTFQSIKIFLISLVNGLTCFINSVSSVISAGYNKPHIVSRSLKCTFNSNLSCIEFTVNRVLQSIYNFLSRIISTRYIYVIKEISEKSLTFGTIFVYTVKNCLF